MPKEPFIEGMFAVAKQNSRIDRRTFLKIAGIGAGRVALATSVLSGVGCVLLDNQPQLPDYVLKSITDPNLKESALAWRTVYTVARGDTIDRIAKKYYPDFNDNQPFYEDKLRYAIGQDVKQSTLLRIGQAIYIPNPSTPTLGFAAGEKAVLRGKEINGKYLPTEVRTINLNKKTIEVYFDNGISEIPLKVGQEFSTDRYLRIAAIFEGISDALPPRVVFEIFEPRGKITS